MGFTKLNIEIDEELYKRFKEALVFVDENETEVFNMLINMYIQNVLTDGIDETSEEVANCKIEKMSNNVPSFLFEGEQVNKENFIVYRYKKDNELRHDISNENVKIKNKVPKWAFNKNMFPHRIIKVYFECQRDNEKVNKKEMIKLFLKEYPDCSLEKFQNNYQQMKSNKGNSYGNVFYDDSINVYLTLEAKDIVEKYKDYFLNN